MALLSVVAIPSFGPPSDRVQPSTLKAATAERPYSRASVHTRNSPLTFRVSMSGTSVSDGCQLRHLVWTTLPPAQAWIQTITDTTLSKAVPKVVASTVSGETSLPFTPKGTV